MTGELSFVVAETDTAVALGSGDVSVLATPRLLAWCEAATVAAAVTALDLPPGGTSVGTRVVLDHLLATPVGARVTVAATVSHQDGRLLRFSVSAHDQVGAGPRLIGTAEVTRVVVDRERFMARLPDPNRDLGSAGQTPVVERG